MQRCQGKSSCPSAPWAIPNREDMIDPAILRPGWLDVKIKIERPDAEAAKDIFSKYVLTELPLRSDDLAEHGGSPRGTMEAMIQRTARERAARKDQVGKRRTSGIVPGPPPARTRKSPVSLSVRPAGRRREVGSPPRRRSWSGRRC